MSRPSGPSTSRQSWPGTRAAFEQAAAWYVGVTAEVGGREDGPGLGEWTVRDLVGHTSRSLVTVEDYLTRPVATVAVTSPADYYRQVLAAAGDPAAVAQRGRDAAAALGADVPRAVAGRAAGRGGEQPRRPR